MKANQSIKTMRFTKLANGYWLATKGLRVTYMQQDTWDMFKHAMQAEVGDARNLYVWHVCNGVAHMLSVKAQSLV